MVPEVKEIIGIRHLSKTFLSKGGEVVHAVDAIDLSIPENAFTCIVGASGCGKSTLLRMTAGLEKPTEGTVFYRSTPVTKPCGEIGLVFQDYSLFPWMTVLDNVGIGPSFAGISRQKRNVRALKYLDMVDMLDFKGAYPHELSGGMRQRVAIARALANEPDVLLMDEPFGALDAHTRMIQQQELLRVWQRTGKTIVLVTHSVDEAVYLADDIVIMAGRPGRIRRIIDVPTPRPRHRADQGFGVLVDSIFKELCSP
ncbi:ABC transporter ATP-binding protein [Desulfatiferula olefinivorans]